MESSKINHVRRLTAGLILALVAVIVLSAAGFGLYFRQALSPINSQNKKEMKVVIPSGTSVSDISRILQKKGLIREAWVFQYYAKIKHLNQYRGRELIFFSRSMSIGQMVHDLESGKQRHAIVLSVQEGQWVKDIAVQISKVSGLKEQDVLDKLSDRHYIQTHYMKKNILF
ncbi:endolytic transglycosylase MltG [Terrilactibacillus sp. S3-3]|nr:endolytic transglycosylase MltG [Terrilactibacillus sp. S3-3]